MAVPPIVRYMIVCEDWQADPNNQNRVNILGLLTNIVLSNDQSYPLEFGDVCVFLALAETRGPGTFQVIGIFEETGEEVFGISEKRVVFPNRPLEVVGIPVRIHNCRFPRPGLYSVQFLFNGQVIEERPLRLR